MTTTPVNRLISKLAVPTVISMLITAIYNIADTLFVSHINESASGAVGIVFSIMSVTQAVGFAIGMGSGSWISILLGARKNEEANKIASSGLFLGLVAGLIFAIFGNIFLKPLLYALASTEDILPYAEQYGKYILLASPVNISAFVLNNLLRSEGKAKFAMIGIMTGGILNCFLDPLFIFGFGWGTAGAALASATGQLISFLILLSMFLRGKTILTISVKKFFQKFITYIKIFKFGMPSMCRQGLASISTVALNWSAKIVAGTVAISAMSISTKVMMFMFSIMIGIGQGYQPVVGYNYSAKLYQRVLDSFNFMLKSSIVVCTILAAGVFVTADKIMLLFIGENAKVIEIGSMALRAQCVAMPFVPVNVLCNMSYQAIGKPLQSSLTSSLRQGIVFIPIVLILPSLIGILGVELAQPIADLASFIITVPFALKFRADIRRKL